MPRGSRWGPRGLGQYLRPSRVAPAVFPKQAQIPFTVFGMAEAESLVPGESRPYRGGGWRGGRVRGRAGGQAPPPGRPCRGAGRNLSRFSETAALTLPVRINGIFGTGRKGQGPRNPVCAFSNLSMTFLRGYGSHYFLAKLPNVCT